MVNKILLSLWSFLIALLCLFVGLIIVIFPWSEAMTSEVFEFILNNSLAISLLGFGLFIMGIGRLFFIIRRMKYTYFYLKSAPNPVWIDETIILNYVENYWKVIFPKRIISNRVILKKNKIFLLADLPYVPRYEQKELINKVQKDLGDIFSRMLGYKEDFTFSASFQPNPIKLKD